MIKTPLNCTIIIGIILLIFISCNSDKPESLATAAERAVNDTLLGKKIIIPETFEAYIPDKKNILMDSLQMVLANYKVFSFINVSCVSCISDIDKWDSLSAELIQYGVPVILICDSKDNFEYIKYLFEQGKINHYSFPLFFDSKDEFYKKNRFIRQDLAHQVVLTNKNNEIIASGNPIYSNKIKERYLQKINRK